MKHSVWLGRTLCLHINVYLCVSNVKDCPSAMHRVAKAGGLQLKVLKEAIEQRSNLISKLEEKVYTLRFYDRLVATELSW